MYSPYYGYNSQLTIDKINSQMNDLEKMKQQLQQNMQPAINQTFQLTPQNNGGLKIVNNVDDVVNELAITDTAFVNKDYSILWIKNNKGNIRSFNIEEIKVKDEKDLIIEKLQYQVYQLNNKIEGMNKNEEYDESSNEHENKQHDKSSETNTTSDVSDDRTNETN